MDVLVLGGSVFLGRAVVEEALAIGARVSVFNRGRSGPTPPGAIHVRGDRTVRADLEQLTGSRFDVVVDTSGYVPADVALATSILEPDCGSYVFVSSINVFPDWPARADYQSGGVHNAPPDAGREDVPDAVEPAAAYGWLKSGCERAARRAFGADRTCILRAGSIVGPHDGAIGRLPAWLQRVARGGDVLVPATAEDPIALIDARDLARFALSAQPGAFEAGGPTGRDNRGDLMRACREATGSDARFTYVDETWLADQGVEAWTEIPLWAPGEPGVFHHDVAAAAEAGLTWRPLADTVADTWAWQQDVPGGWRPTDRTPGLSAEREAQLLTRWRA